MDRVITACFISLFVLASARSVYSTLYTRCSNLISVRYKPEPLYTGTCKTLMEATTQCLKSPVCDLISKDGTHCSFHTANDRVACDPSGISNGGTNRAKFRSCNCTLLEDHWLGAGPIYQYVTPNTYMCSEGPAVCMDLGGIMAEFYSIDELNYALTYITEDIFIGGHIQNGKYVWMSTGEEIMQSLWAQSQPSNNYPCVQIWYEKQGVDDFLVSSSYPRPILCQKRIQ